MKGTEILLHACCAPCATASTERLIENGDTPILYYSNSNIFPRDEWSLRLDNLQRLAEAMRLKIHVDAYDHDAWRAAVKGYESEPEGGERCRRCFRYNLDRASRKMQKLGLSRFTTTLTISPWKNSPTLFEVGGAFPGFEEWNFKKKEGYKRSLELARQFELYRQNWCGCEFSQREQQRQTGL